MVNQQEFSELAKKTLNGWLSGTNCHYYKKLFWESPDKRFVILHHRGHTEYIGRFSGHSYCQTHYTLMKNGIYSPYNWDKEYIHQWNGRWKKEYWKEVYELCGQNI